jgi:hypothetical protein
MQRVALSEPTASDKKEDNEVLMERAHKQRTRVVTTMAEVYQNAYRESFPPQSELTWTATHSDALVMRKCYALVMSPYN